jgi:hypothetical protein
MLRQLPLIFAWSLAILMVCSQLLLVQSTSKVDAEVQHLVDPLGHPFGQLVGLLAAAFDSDQVDTPQVSGPPEWTHQDLAKPKTLELSTPASSRSTSPDDTLPAAVRELVPTDEQLGTAIAATFTDAASVTDRLIVDRGSDLPPSDGSPS